MDEDNDAMAPAFEGDGSGQVIDETDARSPATTSVSIEHDTSWLAGGGVGYHVQVHSDDGTRWVCVRRYSEFAMLREVLVARSHRPSIRNALLALPFPEKRWMGSADIDTVRERRCELERWMNGAIAVCPTNAAISEFLKPTGLRDAGLMTPGGSGSFNGASGSLGSDAEDWAELEKVRQLRESILRSQVQKSPRKFISGGALPDQSVAVPELEPEPEPGNVRGDDDLLEILIREAAADAELDSNFSLPPLRDSVLAATAANSGPPSPSTGSHKTVAADLSRLETPPRLSNGVKVPYQGGLATPPETDQRGTAEKNNQEAYNADRYEQLLRAGGKQSLESVCAVLDRVVPLLDVPQKHTPRRRRRLLEDRVEKLLELLRPTESGSELQQRWAAAAALMQLEPNVASELAAGLAELAALPTQTAYAGYTGLSAAAVVTLASVLRTLELAAAGRSTGNLLEQEVVKKLSHGGENAVACVAAALDHCLALVDIPQSGVSRRYRRALEHDILEAQSCLERGLGLKIAGRGLQPPLLDALVQAIVSVQRLVPSELQNQSLDAADWPMQTAVSDVKTETASPDAMAVDITKAGLLSDKTRLDSDEDDWERVGNEHFVAMQRLLRLLVRPDTDPEVMHARKEEARVTELRVARRREQRITAVLARKAWGPADDAGLGLPTATEKLRLQQEEEASAMLRMRMLEAKEEMMQRQEETRQERLALNRQRRARLTRRGRQLGLCAVVVLAFALRSSPVALNRARAAAKPVTIRARAVYGRVHELLGPAGDRALNSISPVLKPVLQTMAKLQPAMQGGVELWARMIDWLVRACLPAVRILFLFGKATLKTLRRRVLVPTSTVFNQAFVKIRRQ